MTLDTKKQKILLEKALQRYPGNSKLLFAYHSLCQKENETGKVRDVSAYCKMCVEANEIDKALSCCEEAINHNPNSDVVITYGKLFIYANSSTRIIETLIKVLKKTPLNVRARGMIAYIEQKTDCCVYDSALYNTKRDIGVYEHQIHKDLIDSLVHSIRNKLVHVFEPCRTSTKIGDQAVIDHGKYQFMDPLVSLINLRIEKYVKELSEVNHPNITFPLPEYELSVWSVSLNKGGHQDLHIHTSGWISGVVYLKVSNADGSEAGCLEIGCPPGKDLEPFDGTLVIKPEPGLMVLFPSYYFHRTIPTTSNEERICVSFDVIIQE